MGKAKSLRDRVSSYFSSFCEKNGEAIFQPAKDLLPKTQSLVKEIKKIDHITVESEIDALILEANLIKKYWPRYNIAGKDDKRFPFIEIGIKNKVPIVKIARQPIDPKKLYFGPYPTGSDVTGLLRFLRRIFPYVSQPHRNNKPCLRSHLGLCPCQNLKDYRPNLKKMTAFLSGKRDTVQKQLLKEMTAAAKNQDFEKANDIKKKLQQIEYITQPRRAGWEYEANPNLVADQRQKELQDLQRLLDLPRLQKIECYDISNTAGKNATGAQVTFVAGEPDKSLYRRYKIKQANIPNDTAMIAEVTSRRLKSNIPLPELIVLDGGKGQLSAVSATVNREQRTVNPMIIALAKRLETIYTDTNQEINLPANSPALHLLQHLRDEAHRFSRRYHFYLRHKNMLA